MAHDSYFMILVEVFANHILVGNIFQESHRVNRMQYYSLKTCKQVTNNFRQASIFYRAKVLKTLC